MLISCVKLDHALYSINYGIITSPPQVEFKISQLAISGLKVNRLDMYGEVSQQN